MFLIWWWWTVFVEWLTDGRCSVQLYFQPEALSDVLTIPNLQHSEEDWNMCRTECKALLNESAQLWQLLHHDIIILLITNVRQGIHFDRKNLGKEKETKWNNKETKHKRTTVTKKELSPCRVLTSNPGIFLSFRAICGAIYINYLNVWKTWLKSSLLCTKL